MKKGFILMAMLALGAAALVRTPLVANEGASGQGDKGGGRSEKALASGPGASIEWLGRELKLTDAQKQQLYAIDRDLEQQANDIRQDNLLSPQEKELRMKALHESLSTRIKAVLTSDQIQRFDQMGGLKAMMAGPRSVEGIAVMKGNVFERLQLTDAQKAAIEQVMAQDKERFAAAGGDVEKLRALKQETWQRIMAVLTPEQQMKMAEARSIELENKANRMPDLGFLGLTAGQEPQLKAILEQAAPRAHAIMDDRSLSDAEKQARLTALYQEFRPQFLSVLTPEQEQKLRARLLEGPREQRDPSQGPEPGGK
jgi:Spy/CpxP family protein refolding chaperone